ncbi:unnamed protein product [Ophioblennius macclurei]
MCPRKPSDLALRPKVPGGRVTSAGTTSTCTPVSSCTFQTTELSAAYPRHPLQRRNPVIPGTVKLPPGVLPQPATATSAHAHAPENGGFLYRLKRREQPGRRRDSTQSLYIDNAECEVLLNFSSCPSSASSSSLSISMVTPSAQGDRHETEVSKSQRRLSDPDIPCLDDDV